MLVFLVDQLELFIFGEISMSVSVSQIESNNREEKSLLYLVLGVEMIFWGSWKKCGICLLY